MSDVETSSASSAESPILTLEDIQMSYQQPNGNRLPVLEIEQFQLNPSEQCVLIGESGSGKTTLLNLISGIRLPDSGVVRIRNLDITRLSEAGRDRFRADHIGVVFQTFNLMPGFTGLENVLLAMRFASGRVNHKLAEELMDRVGMSHRLHHVPEKMSVGEQQRVAVARALANHPSLIIADEPTANVDRKNQQAVVDLIRNTCEERSIALLMVTHAEEVAKQFDRVDSLETLNGAVKV
ncbi:Lipoprotein releasing system ATP-binding protein lolD [Planctomycetales bacterium 10988]|nr:Lipoprotein releasing system ATP-binding protein lolD [Planctomycetales bacterium 10988]